MSDDLDTLVRRAIDAAIVEAPAPGVVMSPQRAVKMIRAAVEAREAKLREPLRRAVISLMQARATLMARQTVGALALDGLSKLIADLQAALAGAGPDYVPRADLDAVKEKLEGSWGVLLDAMLDAGAKNSASVYIDLAGRVGLPNTEVREEKLWSALTRERTPMTLAQLRDADLVAEVKRRGLVSAVVRDVDVGREA